MCDYNFTFVTGISFDFDSNRCSSLAVSIFTESSLDHSESPLLL